MRTDGQTDTTKLTAAFSNFAKAPKKMYPSHTDGIRISYLFIAMNLRKHLAAYTFQDKFQEPVPEDIPFPCDTAPGSPGARSATRPTSVHHLRPGDIDVIGAMGDSLTAGSASAAANLVEIFIENRGMSWSGGESNISLPTRSRS